MQILIVLPEGFALKKTAELRKCMLWPRIFNNWGYYKQCLRSFVNFSYKVSTVPVFVDCNSHIILSNCLQSCHKLRKYTKFLKTWHRLQGLTRHIQVKVIFNNKISKRKEICSKSLEQCNILAVYILNYPEPSDFVPSNSKKILII